jgi:hypothetical protein
VEPLDRSDDDVVQAPVQRTDVLVSLLDIVEQALLRLGDDEHLSEVHVALFAQPSLGIANPRHPSQLALDASRQGVDAGVVDRGGDMVHQVSGDLPDVRQAVTNDVEGDDARCDTVRPPQSEADPDDPGNRRDDALPVGEHHLRIGV